MLVFSRRNVGATRPTGALLDLLNCITDCLSRRIFVTSTSEKTPKHPPGTPHARGVAADLRYRWPAQTLCCAAKCGAGFALDEKKHPQKETTGPNIHVQVPRGRKGGRGDLPDPKTC